MNITLSLTSVATAIANIYSSAEAVVAAGVTVVVAFEKIKPYVVALVDVAEQTYATSTTAGATKLAAVLAAVQAVAAKLGVDWSAGLESVISDFIATAKAAYNAAASAVSSAGSAVTTLVTTATAATPAAPAVAAV